jgi:aromatic ring hydroxylase
VVPRRQETDARIVVSGAKVVATGSVLTNFTFVAHRGLTPVQDKNLAMVFMIPTNALGREVHLPHLLRDDLDRKGQPVRLLPMENVFVYGDIEIAVLHRS